MEVASFKREIFVVYTQLHLVQVDVGHTGPGGVGPLSWAADVRESRDEPDHDISSDL